LPLPAFLCGENGENPPSPADIRNGFRLTGFFLDRDLFAARGQPLPEARGAYIADLRKRFDWRDVAT
jgi:DNA repair protein RecO (recombination protein O)